MALRVTAVKTIRYGGKLYQKGAHFDASPTHAKVLSLMGKILIDEKQAPKKVKPEKKAAEPAKVMSPPEEKKVEVAKKEEPPKKVAKPKDEERQGEVKSQMFHRRDSAPEEPK